MTHRSRESAPFGPCIRAARLGLAEPLTQEALAREVGVAQPTVSAWESGEVFPTFSNLVRLCGVLNLDVAELVAKIAADAEGEGIPA